MPGPVKPIPDGYTSVTPYLIVHDGAAALAWYEKAFGAKELMRFPSEDGRIAHAELQVGNARIMMADEFPEMQARSAKSYGGSAVQFMIYVDSADKAVERAVAAGATLKRPVADQFYGDRSGTVEDPFGFVWTIGTHMEDLTLEEVRKRAEKAHA
jgi:PhnB protein